MNDLELEREIRAAFRRRELDIGDPAALSPAHEAVRRARRRQLATVVTTLAAVVAVVIASFAGVSALLRSAGREVPAGPSGESLLICPPGSTPDRPGPVDRSRPQGGMFGSLAFDRGSGRMVLLPGGEDRPEIWTFDVCTNTWQRIAWAPERGPWPQLTYDADSDLTVMIIGRSVTAYDLDHNAWAAKGDAPIPFPGWPVYDPVSGLLFVFVSDAERSEMWTYDVDTDRWREVEQKGVVPFATANELLAYDASADRIVLYAPDACVGVEGDPSVDCGGDRTFEFDPRSHTWSAPRTDTPDLNLGGWPTPRSLITYDETKERTVIFGDGTVAAYDATADDWEIAFGGGIGGFGRFDRMFPIVGYDPVNRRIVVVGGEHRVRDPDTHEFVGWESLDDVWAFDLATREWIQLLAPTPGL